jgi:hypothetical protein
MRLRSGKIKKGYPQDIPLWYFQFPVNYRNRSFIFDQLVGGFAGLVPVVAFFTLAAEAGIENAEMGCVESFAATVSAVWVLVNILRNNVKRNFFILFFAQE